METEDNTPEITAHIIAEDPRYPLLCINGKFTYGLSINPKTGDIDPERLCICEARSHSECICDLEPGREKD